MTDTPQRPVDNGTNDDDIAEAARAATTKKRQALAEAAAATLKNALPVPEDELLDPWRNLR